MRVGPYADTGDEFHPPVNDDDHEWAETCWFTFAVPERRLSGQQYCYFKPTLGVVAAAAYVWDDTGDQVWNCRYAKNFWHLPFPDASLSDLTLANGIRHRVRQPGVCYAIGYDDPDGDELHVDLTFTALSTPHLLGEHHLDQPGRCVGEIVLGGESIAVDSFGFRDRSWGRRTQYGPGIHETHCKTGGYSYATASAEEAFLAITLDFGDGSDRHPWVLDPRRPESQSGRRPAQRRRTRPVDRGADQGERRSRRRTRTHPGRLRYAAEPARLPGQPEFVDLELPHRMELERHQCIR